MTEQEQAEQAVAETLPAQAEQSGSTNMNESPGLLMEQYALQPGMIESQGWAWGQQVANLAAHMRHLAPMCRGKAAAPALHAALADADQLRHRLIALVGLAAEEGL